eukprot:6637921-Heterocapsa_arctica.AAC.1
MIPRTSPATTHLLTQRHADACLQCAPTSFVLRAIINSQVVTQTVSSVSSSFIPMSSILFQLGFTVFGRLPELRSRTRFLLPETVISPRSLRARSLGTFACYEQ